MRREPKVFARSELHRRLPSFVRANLVVITIVTALFAAAGGLLSLVTEGYERGFFDGALTMTLVLAVGLAFLMYDDGFWRVGGAWAEEFTRSELAKAERRGYVWATVNGIALEGYDIDHVVFSPAGVLAVDSKWHFRATDKQSHYDARSATGAARSARAVLRSIGEPSEVTPLVVVAGPGSHDLGPEGHIVEGVRILSREFLVEWLGSHQTGAYPRDQAQRVADLLRQFRATHGPGRRNPRRFGIRPARADSR
jgi:hypothetical protein